MGETVYKYELGIDDAVLIQMPKGAEPLYVDEQNGKAFLWAKVDTAQPYERKVFQIRGTGHPFNGSEGKYIGSFQQLNGRLVWHVFEER